MRTIPKSVATRVSLAPGTTTRPAEDRMPFKFLFVSYDGLIGDIAWQVTKEGH